MRLPGTFTRVSIRLEATITRPVRTAEDVFVARKTAMVTAIEADAAEVGSIDDRSEFPLQVIAVIGAHPRRLLVFQYLQELAYTVGSLPIGWREMTSKPCIMAWMTGRSRCRSNTTGSARVSDSGKQAVGQLGNRTGISGSVHPPERDLAQASDGRCGASAGRRYATYDN